MRHPPDFVGVCRSWPAPDVSLVGEYPCVHLGFCTTGEGVPQTPVLVGATWEANRFHEGHNRGMTPGAPAMGAAAFVVDEQGSRRLELVSAPPVRGASVIKPLLAWVAGTAGALSDDLATWEAYARPAVTTSDNTATAEIWERCRGERLLATLNARADLGWRVEGDGEHPSLRVEVTASELARAYASFVGDGGAVARQVRQWMREVPLGQAFGLRRVAGEALAVDEAVVGVKCGWFGGERVHAVVIAETEEAVLGAAVTTNRPPDAWTTAMVREVVGDDMKLAMVHDRLVGEHIRTAARRALRAARDM